jgi:hypothetical protein
MGAVRLRYPASQAKAEELVAHITESYFSIYREASRRALVPLKFAVKPCVGASSARNGSAVAQAVQVEALAVPGQDRRKRTGDNVSISGSCEYYIFDKPTFWRAWLSML